MRQVIKTVSNKPVEFIPTSQKEDATLSKDAPEIKNRPLIFMVRKLTREDRFNLQSLAEINEKNGEINVSNMGTVAKYIWDNCVVEVLNLMSDIGEFDSAKGKIKNSLFSAEGLEQDVAEVIKFIQDSSSFTEEEAKN